MRDIFSVQNKTVLVTGGSRGIGAMIARSFAEHGAKVIVSSRKEAACNALVQELSRITECHALPADVASTDEIVRLAMAFADRFEKLDILINNAGATWGAPLEEFPVAGWDKTMNVNLRAPFFLIQQLLPFMNTASPDGASVINIASIDGLAPPAFNSYAYSASKAGVIALTKSLGKELADSNIAVNCITPAAARTAIFDQMSQEHIDYMLSKIPRGRFVELKEISSMIAWMVSAENSFTTGAVFDLSGGRSTY